MEEKKKKKIYTYYSTQIIRESTSTAITQCNEFTIINSGTEDVEVLGVILESGQWLTEQAPDSYTENRSKLIVNFVNGDNIGNEIKVVRKNIEYIKQ